MNTNPGWLDLFRFGVLFAAFVLSFIAFHRSRKAQAEATNAAQAQTIAKLMEEYATPEMGKAIIRMRKWRDRIDALRIADEMKGADVEKARKLWNCLSLTGGEPKLKDDSCTDDARRKVRWYFYKIWQLRNVNYLTDKSTRILTDTSGYALLFDAVWPLTRVTTFATIESNSKYFEWYTKMQTDFKPRPRQQPNGASNIE